MTQPQQSPSERADLLARLTDAREVFDSLSIYVSEGSLAALEIEQSQASIDAALSFLTLSASAQPAEADGWVMVPREQWDAAYRAFVGAFDTAVARRRQEDEYAIDARRRMRALNDALAATPKAPPSAAGEVGECTHAFHSFPAPNSWGSRCPFCDAPGLTLATLPAPNDDLRAVLDLLVAGATVEWSYHEDEIYPPRDFWHVRMNIGDLSLDWTKCGRQEKPLTDEERAKGEADARDYLRRELEAALKENRRG